MPHKHHTPWFSKMRSRHVTHNRMVKTCVNKACSNP